MTGAALRRPRQAPARLTAVEEAELSFPELPSLRNRTGTALTERIGGIQRVYSSMSHRTRRRRRASEAGVLTKVGAARA